MDAYVTSLPAALPHDAGWLVSHATRAALRDRLPGELTVREVSAPQHPDQERLLALWETGPAAVRLAGESDVHGVSNGFVAACDPVSLQADMRDVRIALTLDGRLEANEALALSESVAALLAEDPHDALRGLQLHIPVPWRWYAVGRDGPGPEFVARAADELVGLPLRDHRPQGRDALALQRLATEVQMALHTHPANRQRSARGEPPVNGVWWWGSGHMPASDTVALPPLAATAPVWRGLWRLANAPVAHAHGTGGVVHVAADDTLPQALREALLGRTLRSVHVQASDGHLEVRARRRWWPWS